MKTIMEMLRCEYANSGTFQGIGLWGQRQGAIGALLVLD
jgi:hypothetical protein